MAKPFTPTKEGLQVARMYQSLSRWERNAAFVLLQSLAWGRLNKTKTDRLPWPKVARMLRLPAK